MFGTPTAPPAKMRPNGPQVAIPRPVQIAFVYLDKRPVWPNKDGVDEAKPFSVTFLIPKHDAELVNWFQNLLCGFMGIDNTDGQGIMKIPVHPFINGVSLQWNDGDAEKNKEYQGFAGHWFCKATTDFDSLREKYSWTIVEMDGTRCPARPVVNGELYPGCFVEAVICCSEYVKPGQVKFYLGGIKKVGKGEQWAGQSQAAELLGMADKTSMLQAPKAAPVQQPPQTPQIAQYVPPAGPPQIAPQPQYQAPAAAPAQYQPPAAPQPPQQYQPPVQPFQPGTAFNPPPLGQQGMQQHPPMPPLQHPGFAPPAGMAGPAPIHAAPGGVPQMPNMAPQQPINGAQAGSPSQLTNMLNRPPS